jgi:oligoribonuclease NrnB/cAMP/cGMP phosphodiesterase (DHH superfamily)
MGIGEIDLIDETTSTLCIYHDDADGRCGAAIVRRALGLDVILYAMDYGDPVPWEIVERVPQVIITDFSLPREWMMRIMNARRLIWIDHHKTSLEGLSDLEHLPGKREIDQAACVLTWEMFFPDDDLPLAVVYIGDRDVWRHAFPETKYFSEALFQEESDPSNDRLWTRLLNDDRKFVAELVERGRLLYQARINSIEHLIDRHGFEVEFEGYRTLAINGSASGELGEAIRKRGFEIGYCYRESVQNGDLVTFVTLYSEQVDASEIAKRFGGGGHAGAAGFSFKRGTLPFPEDARVRKIGQE